MNVAKERYVTDAKGARKGVVLSLSRYRRLLEDLHDLAAADGVHAGRFGRSSTLLGGANVYLESVQPLPQAVVFRRRTIGTLWPFGLPVAAAGQIDGAFLRTARWLAVSNGDPSPQRMFVLAGVLSSGQLRSVAVRSDSDQLERREARSRRANRSRVHLSLTTHVLRAIGSRDDHGAQPWSFFFVCGRSRPPR